MPPVGGGGLVAATGENPVELTSIPQDIAELLGTAPLTHFESLDAYNKILSLVASTVEPRDVIEWIWLKDVVDLIWETRRLRRAKATVLALARRDALISLISPPDDGMTNVAMEIAGGVQAVYGARADGYVAGDAADVQFVQRRLQQQGIGEGAIEGGAYRRSLDDLERLERLLVISDTRRDAILRDMERRREAVGRRLREAAELAIEGEPMTSSGAD